MTGPAFNPDDMREHAQSLVDETVHEVLGPGHEQRLAELRSLSPQALYELAAELETKAHPGAAASSWTRRTADLAQRLADEQV